MVDCYLSSIFQKLTLFLHFKLWTQIILMLILTMVNAIQHLLLIVFSLWIGSALMLLVLEKAMMCSV